MASRKQWSIGILAGVLVLGLVAYLNRVDIALGLVSIAVDQARPVGPNRDITWQTGSDPEGRAPEERPPNIVLILADDLGWNDLTFNGGGVAGGTVPTPHIDSIAQQGVYFTNGYAANGTCAPSRAALMSGRYGTRFGFEFTPTPPGMAEVVSLMRESEGRLRDSIQHTDAQRMAYEEMGMPAAEITIAELLRDEGYHTVHIGKWHLGLDNGMAAQHQGYKESLLMSSGLYLPEDHPDVVNARQDFDPIDRFLWAAMRFSAIFNAEGGNDFNAFEPDGYITDYYTAQAVEVIEANKHRPFFLYLAHWTPHTPLQATREDYEALFWRSGASQSALVNGWKLNVSSPPGRSWLFDMNADPNEQRDLSRESPGKLAELQAALAAHNAEQAPPAWPSRLTIPINIDKDLTHPDSPEDEYIYWSN